MQDTTLRQLIAAFSADKYKGLYCGASCTERQKADESGRTTKMRCLHRFQLVKTIVWAVLLSAAPLVAMYTAG